MGVQGGFQMENETAGLWNVNPGVTLNNVTDEHNLSNGTTYVLDSPIIPSARSVYKVLTDDEDTYGEFYNLFAVDEEIIKACGLVDVQNLTKSKQTSEMKKYYFFVDDNGPDYNVQFYNNYRYTVLAPTNAAVEAAIAAGLPSWESITEDYEECEKDEDNVLVNGEDSLRLQTKIVYLTNFLRNHFLDNSVFVDKSTIEATEYVSASYNSEKGLFCKINVRRSGGVLESKDDNDGECLTASGKVNVMPRDVSCSSSPKTASTMNGITIDATSFSVIHQIPGVMNHTELVGGRYDSTWSTAAKCKNYLSKFAIR